jgi:hypothetical protein
VNIPEIEAVLVKAMAFRMPDFDPDGHPREKIAGLEDHILECARQRADVERALYWCIEAGKRLRDEWDDIQGWQAGVGTRPTKERIDGEKRKIKPELWVSLEKCRTLTEALRRQAYRMGGSDYDAASRAYTLLSGS